MLDHPILKLVDDEYLALTNRTPYSVQPRLHIVDLLAADPPQVTTRHFPLLDHYELGVNCQMDARIPQERLNEVQFRLQVGVARLHVEHRPAPRR